MRHERVRRGLTRGLMAALAAGTVLVAATLIGADNVRPGPRARSQTTLVTVSAAGTGADGRSDSPSLGIAADGRHVCFGSEATNLVPGDHNDSDDVFVSDQVGR